MTEAGSAKHLSDACVGVVASRREPRGGARCLDEPGHSGSSVEINLNSRPVPEADPVQSSLIKPDIEVHVVLL